MQENKPTSQHLLILVFRLHSLTVRNKIILKMCTGFLIILVGALKYYLLGGDPIIKVLILG